MLRIIQNTAPQSAKSYYQRGDYYAEGKEGAGCWGGKAARMLGLEGQVQQADFEAMCDNVHPGTGERLTRRTKELRTVGYDFNFHAPKSVSVVEALTGDERIALVFRDAVRETMEELEREAKTRVRRGSENVDRIVGNLVWAEFVHRTTRPVDGVPDPHLHAHCFTFNAVYDGKESRWKAGQFRDLKRDAGYFEAAFQSRFAEKLKGLGYAIERTGRSFEIAGVSRDVIERFSRRTQQIEAIAAERGIVDPKEKAKLGAATRRGKSFELSPEQLQAEWRGRLTEEEDGRLRALPMAAPTNSRTPVAPEVALQHGKDHCFERSSVAPVKRLLEQALRYGVGQVGVEEVQHAFRASDVLYGEREGRMLATTREVLREEQELLRFARDSRGSLAPLNPDWIIQRSWLNAGQKGAIAHLLQSADRVQILKGRAGTGKTTLMQEAVEAIEAKGQKVFTFAPSAEASRGVLRQKGFDGADTVARLLVDQKLQERVAGGVLWIDEAGLIGTRTLGQVFQLAEQRDCRVILSGDWSQHGSVERGAAMRLLAQSAGLRVAEVNQIQRQKAHYKEVVDAISRGKLQEGFEELQRLHWVKECADEFRPLEIAKAYAASLEQYKETLVVSPTHREGLLTTAAIRDELKRRGTIAEAGANIMRLESRNLTEAERRDPLNYQAGDLIIFQQNAKGRIKGERIAVTDRPDAALLQQAGRFQVFRPAAIEVAAGDRIRFTANGMTRDKSHRINNGASYLVAGFTPEGDIRLDNGWTVSKDFGHLSHGYVVTSHASQGKSVDHVILAQSSLSRGAANQEQWYVSVSRGEQRCTVFTDDVASLKEAIQRHEERLTATEFVAQRRTRRVRDLVRRHVATRGYANASASLLRATQVDRDYVR